MKTLPLGSAELKGLKVMEEYDSVCVVCNRGKGVERGVERSWEEGVEELGLEEDLKGEKGREKVGLGGGRRKSGGC